MYIQYMLQLDEKFIGVMLHNFHLVIVQKSLSRPVTSPEGSRRLRLPAFLDSQINKVARLSALCTGHNYSPPPGDTPGTHIWYRLSQSHGHSVARRIKSMKNSHHPNENQTHELPACSMVPQPTVPLHTLLHLVKTSISCKESHQPDIQ